jgi:short-subunit dehydrogenase
MKISITGHTQGLGSALYRNLINHGHDVIGLSLDNEYNIHDTERILEQVLPTECFINNAQSGFAQTELFLAVSKQWLNVPDKKIINIGSLLMLLPSSPYSSWNDLEYFVHKLSLQEAVKQVRNQKYHWPKICTVNPGPLQTTHTVGMDTDLFAKEVLSIIENSKFYIEEISIGLYNAW